MNERFQTLSLGKVKPLGWLLNQIRCDVESGLAAHLDQLTEYFDAATWDPSIPVKQRCKLWWASEVEGAWFYGFVVLAWLADHDDAKAKAEAYVEKVLAFQQPDGYLGIYPPDERYESPGGTMNGELWAQTCLFRGLLAYYELSGRDEVLQSVEKAARLTMSQYSEQRPYFRGEFMRGGVCHGLMFVEIMEWLHRLTGDVAFVEFAEFLYRSYCTEKDAREVDVLPENLLDAERPLHGHGVHVLEHLRVPLWLAFAKDSNEYGPLYRAMIKKVLKHCTASGAMISDEDVLGREPLPETGCEYCGMTEWMVSLQSALTKTGDAGLADYIEQVAYNAAQAARLPDGKAVAYLTRDNRPSAAVCDHAGGRFKFSPTHDDVAPCCPVNAVKFPGLFAAGTWLRDGEDGIVAAVLAPSRVEATFQGIQVVIEEITNYPFSDDIRFQVTPRSAVRGRLLIREPKWSNGTEVVCVSATIRRKDGYISVEKEWQAGDEVLVHLMPQIDVKQAVGGERFLQRGPLVYGLPIASDPVVIKNWPVDGFADLDMLPAADTVWDWAVPDQLDFKFAENPQGNSLTPWENAPVQLCGSLLEVGTESETKVTLVPVGSSILCRTTFPTLEEAKDAAAVQTAEVCLDEQEIEGDGEAGALYSPFGLRCGRVDDNGGVIVLKWLVPDSRYQKAFQLRVATSEKTSAASMEFHSGWIGSETSVFQMPLEPLRRPDGKVVSLFWSVRVFDTDGDLSCWSRSEKMEQDVLSWLGR